MCHALASVALNKYFISHHLVSVEICLHSGSLGVEHEKGFGYTWFIQGMLFRKKGLQRNEDHRIGKGGVANNVITDDM